MTDRCAKTGKVSYPTRQAAQAALNAQLNCPLPRLLEVFHCASCKTWHLGNATRRPRRVKR